MSHTFYDSPEGAVPSLSIDVGPEFCWFFEHRPDGAVTVARVGKGELPAIWRALTEYLRACQPCRLCGFESHEGHKPGCLYAESELLKMFEAST